MVNLVVDPRLVIVDCVVLDGLPGELLPETVHHLDLLEMDDDTALCTARHIRDCICLHSDLDRVKSRHHGQLRVPAWLRDIWLECASLKVDGDVTFRHLVDAVERHSYH